LASAQAVIYIATAPKSNAVYKALAEAQRLAREQGSLTPPKIILNAPTKLMKDEGYGEGYRYDHDEADGFSGQNYWPDALPARSLYRPAERGFERELKTRLDYWARLRQSRRNR
jgi:putative ATPase